jgi:outer membrane protein OmpA-like peptidoglycan-associated protein
MLKKVLLLAACVACMPVFAQSVATVSAEPLSATQMIDQLKKPPRTRSLRNLSVESVPGQADAPLAAMPSAPAAAPVVAEPSLSLLIEFDYDSARVRPESRPLLNSLAQALQSEQLCASAFVVEGHTDAKGSAVYNLRLSLLRAQSVRDFLASQGVQVARLKVAGKGSSELANSAQPFAPENRRVRIVNLD